MNLHPSIKNTNPANFELSNQTIEGNILSGGLGVGKTQKKISRR